MSLEVLSVAMFGREPHRVPSDAALNFARKLIFGGGDQ